MRKKIILGVFGLLTSVGIVAVVYTYRSNFYSAVHPKVGDLTEVVYGLGKVKSNRKFELIMGVISSVEKLHVDEGSYVRKGVPLIKLNDGLTFKAPFDGTVTLVSVQEGETALPHVPLLRLEDLNDRYIELSFEQQAALRVKRDQKAKVSFESMRGQVLEGRVVVVYPRQDEFLARVTVTKLEPSILPGMTADVTVEVGTIANATLVPVKAIQNGMVAVKRDKLWKKIKVNIGHTDGTFAEIKDQSLSPQDEIRVKNTE